MIDWRALLAVTGAELRRTRRLVRYWVFVVLAFLIPVGSFLWHALAVHRWGSTIAASFAMINPRYFVSSYGLTFLLIYMLGVVFLAFDVRSRDVRSGVSEVLDARPIGNLELLGGRWLGLLIASWLPLLVLVVLFELAGLAIGVTIEPRSLVSLLTLQAIPSLAQVIAAVFFVTLLVRHRLVAALVLLTLWVAVFSTMMGFVPVTLAQAPLTDLTGWTVSPFPSDLTSAVPDAMAWLHRLGALVLGLALLVLAAVVHPRADGARNALRLTVGLASLLAAAGLITAPYVRNVQHLSRFESYQAAHAERAGPSEWDLTAITGTATVDPGRELVLDLDLSLKPIGDAPVSEVLLTLNPGLAVEALERDGAALPHDVAHGLLSAELTPALRSEETLELHLAARGRLDRAFSYLDASRHMLELTIDSGAVFLFGFESLVFERGFVALMPGAHWLPSPGTALVREGMARPADPFALDLQVELPDDWQAAGPGRARPSAGAPEGRQRVRFAPPAPIARAALVASEFEAFEAEAEGVDLKLLVHPSHVSNLDPLAAAAPELVERIDQTLSEAERIGLPYPYDGLTMVEVPNILRGYAGGWRQDTTFAQPGLVLMRESGLPTARWDVRFDEDFEAGDHEGGKPAAIADGLERFFSGDIGGGNPKACAARSFFDFSVGWEGREAPAIDFVAESLTSWLLTEERTYFSARLFEGEDFQEMIGELLPAFFSSGAENLNESLLRQLLSRPAVWNAVEAAPLAELRTEEDPQQALDALVLKGGALVRSLSEAFDREQLGALLGAVRERHGGQRITRRQLESVAADLEIPLAGWLELWLDSLDVPAFAVESAKVFRAEDAEDGTPRYQHVVRLRNDGAVPGVVLIDSSFEQDEGGSRQESSEPFVIEGEQEVEIGLVHREKATRLEVRPYFAKNRAAFSVNLVQADGPGADGAQPWDGLREVPYGRPRTVEVVVDDLDQGFAATSEEEASWARVGGHGPDDRDLDHGLPVQRLGGAPGRWTRMATTGSWGRYRHTAAVVNTSDPTVKASFSGELPDAGHWHLELHRPKGLEFKIFGYQRLSWAELELTIDAGGTSQQTAWDASAAPFGWARVGRFEMPAGPFEVTLGISGEEGGLIAADALRWVPARSGADTTTVARSDAGESR
jgi:hypothetical protein